MLTRNLFLSAQALLPYFTSYFSITPAYQLPSSTLPSSAPMQLDFPPCWLAAAPASAPAARPRASPTCSVRRCCRAPAVHSSSSLGVEGHELRAAGEAGAGVAPAAALAHGCCAHHARVYRGHGHRLRPPAARFQFR